MKPYADLKYKSSSDSRLRKHIPDMHWHLCNGLCPEQAQEPLHGPKFFDLTCLNEADYNLPALSCCTKNRLTPKVEEVLHGQGPVEGYVSYMNG